MCALSLKGGWMLDALIFNLKRRSQLKSAVLIQRAALTLSAPVAPLRSQESRSAVGPWCPGHIASLTPHFSSRPLQPPCALLALSTLCAARRFIRRECPDAKKRKKQALAACKIKLSSPKSRLHRGVLSWFKSSIHPSCRRRRGLVRASGTSPVGGNRSDHITLRAQ